MVAPLAGFTVIPLADVDPDSPVTTDLMDAFRLNDQNLFAQLVGDPVSAPTFTPAAEHDHDGANSKAVAGANLRFLASAEVSGAAVASVTFAGLDGNVDGQYVLFGYVKPSVNLTDLQLRFNAVSGSYDNSDDASATGAILQSGTAPSGGGVGGIQFRADIFARNSIQSVDFFQSCISHAVHIELLPTTAVRTSNVGGRFSATPLPEANITSLQIISATGGTPIGIGSRFSLYKLNES